MKKVHGAMIKTKLMSLCLLASIALAGCDGSSTLSVEDHLARAQELLDKADFRGSVVELKNVLQKEPDNVNARVLLAEVYAEVGDANSAEKEISRAIELGANNLKAREILGRTLILKRKFSKVLLDFTAESSDSSAKIAVVNLLRGDAYHGLWKNVDADDAYNVAIKAYRKDINEDRPHLKLTESAEYVDAIIGLANIAIRRKLWPVARKHIENALSVSPNDPEALAAKGEIAFKLGSTEESEEAYQTAYDVKPYNLEFQIGIARAQLANNKVDEAIKNLEAVRKHFPNDVIANQYRGLAALQNEDAESAKEFADNILKIAPDYYPAHLIAGAANFGLRNFEQANVFLSRFVAHAPNNLNARKMLGLTQLNLRRGNDALATLQPLSDENPNDTKILNVLAQAAITAGDLNKAGAYYQKVLEVNPANPEAHLKLAVTKLMGGDRPTGIKGLKDSLDQYPSFLKGQYVLADVYLQEREFDKSIEIARELQSADPEIPDPHISEGLAQIGKKSWPEAIASFERAKKLSPGHVGASYGIADIYIRTNKPEKTREIYKDLLAEKPGHYLTMMRWVGLETKEGNDKRVSALLQQTIAANPSAIPPRLLAAQELLHANRPLKVVCPH
jgi:putative PEP-CTERM system TPR-repeat lipoprotein